MENTDENSVTVYTAVIFSAKLKGYIMMMKVKKAYKRAAVIGTLLVALIAVCFTIGYAMAFEGYIINADQKTVAFDNIEHTMEADPFTYEGVSYIPIETTLVHAGYGFGWDSNLNMYEVTGANHTFKLTGESNVVLKDAQKITLSMPIKLKNGLYYAPVDFFEKVLGQKIMVQGRIRNKHTDSLVFFANQREIKLNEATFTLSETAIMYDNEIFMPAKEVLSVLCFNVKETENGLTATRHGRELSITAQNEKMFGGNASQVQAFKYHDMLFVRASKLASVADVEVKAEGKLALCPIGYRDLMENTVVPDTYRTQSGMSYYNGVYVAGTMAMEVLRVSDQDAINYAGVVNTLAEKLPDVTTYSVLVPNSGEFYARSDKTSNHTARIRTAYQHLNSDVVPINAVQPLLDHADEKIYFSTDHHWTQRGAYYAYRAFNDYRGVTTPALETFKTSHINSFVGSFAGFMAGTPGADVCRQNPDFLERFLPFTEVKGEAFSDMKLTKKMDNVSAVDNRYTNYMTFIGGDRPISKFTTSNKNGKSVLIIKESYGNAFATFAMNDYETVFVLDPRKFNGFGGFNEPFNLVEFYKQNHFDDMIIINYPVGMTSALRQAILNLAQ